MRHVERHLGPQVREALDTFRVVVLHGARQSGKTTLAKQVAAERGGTHTTLDDEQTRLAALEDPLTFLREQRHPMVIDEIQLGGDRLIRAVKMAVDDDQATGRFLLTGSTDFLAVPTISESLAGRAAILRLWPMSAAEMSDTAGCRDRAGGGGPGGPRRRQGQLRGVDLHRRVGRQRRRHGQAGPGPGPRGGGADHGDGPGQRHGVALQRATERDLQQRRDLQDVQLHRDPRQRRRRRERAVGLRPPPV